MPENELTEAQEMRKAIWMSEIIPWIFKIIALLCYTYLATSHVIAIDDTWWFLLLLCW